MAKVAEDRGFSSERIHVIPNSVNLEVFTLSDKRAARRRIGIDENGFIALFIAGECGDPQKGYGDFVSATRSAAINAIAIGRLPPVPAACVRHPGPINDTKKMAEYYAAADCLVITSFAETYPTTVIEALACGTPVYGYSVGGIPSQVPAPEDSLVARGDIQALATRLVAFASTRGKTEEISSSLRAYATGRWSEDRIARDYAQLYRKVLRPTGIPEL